MRGCLAVFIVASGVFVSAYGLALQQSSGSALVAGRGSSGVLSATVLSAAHVHTDAEGATALDLLVMLRGAPGWYAHTPRGGSVLTGASSSTTDGHGTANYWTSGGGYTVTFDVDSTRGTVHLKIASSKGTIFDDEVETDRGNIVMVDGVGGDSEPAITTLWIEPRLDGTLSPAALAIRKVSSLVRFVQCDLALPDSTPDEQGPFNRSLRNVIAQSCGEIKSDARR